MNFQSILILASAAVLLFGGPWLYVRLRFLLSKHPELDGLRLPFNGPWLAANGGRVWRNHHLAARAQQFAYDFVIVDPKTRRSHQNDGKALADYFCYDQEIVAAHDGVVLVAVDGIPDGAIGTMNPQMVYGNTVMIQHAQGPVAVYAHLKSGSVAVTVGQTIQAGEVIGRCGNSGNSTEPHLHFHLQSKTGFEAGVGIKPRFRHVVVGLPSEQGANITRENYSPKAPETVSQP